MGISFGSFDMLLVMVAICVLFIVSGGCSPYRLSWNNTLHCDGQRGHASSILLALSLSIHPCKFCDVDLIFLNVLVGNT